MKNFLLKHKKKLIGALLALITGGSITIGFSNGEIVIEVRDKNNVTIPADTNGKLPGDTSQ